MAMQLSILVPTNRTGPLACSRIAQACSWAGPNIEVIVRDNSGNAEKREWLGHLQHDYCTIVTVDPCEPLEQFSALLALAKGDFLYCVADDDFCFDRAMAVLPGTIARHGSDPSFVGVTGTYAIDTSKGSRIVSYQDVDSDDAAARVAGYLNFSGPNVLFYAVLRQDVLRRISAFMRTMPFFFSFHDQIYCLLYLLSGKLIRLERLFYLYDLGIWEDDELGQKRDADFYRAAKMDPAIGKLQWFMCALEGAALTMNTQMFPGYTLAQREAVGSRWLAAMLRRFKDHKRLVSDSGLADKADLLCAALQASTGKLSLADMVMEVSGFIALFSNRQAKSYFDFWNAILLNRHPLIENADRAVSS
jgi:hypothetical protein